MKKYIYNWIAFFAVLLSACGDKHSVSTTNDLGENQVRVQLVRNATVKLNYGGKTILVDPMLGDKGSTDIAMLGVNMNPRVNLPFPADSVLSGVDFVLVSHDHFDHFDEKAKQMMGQRRIQLYTQPANEHNIKASYPSERVRVIEDSIVIDEIKIIRTGGQHGLGKVGQNAGPVSGFVLTAPGEPTIYIMGDVVLTDEIKDNLARYNPDVVIVNSGGAILPFLSVTDGPLIMDEDQTIRMIGLTPDNTKVIAVHMDAVDHCQTSRSILRSTARDAKIDKEKLIIPEDGETIIID